MDYGRPELAERLAADYVTGTLRGAARRRLEALLPAHAALRSAVRDWQERLMPLARGVAPVQPPARVWRRIEARIAGTNRAASARGWWSRLVVWRTWAGAASAAALTLAVLWGTPEPVRAPVMVVLNATAPVEGGLVQATFVAGVSADGRAIVTRPLRALSLQSDRAFELWAVPAEGAPRSLGLISATTPTLLKRSRILDQAAALAVSLEPSGGSPTGAPTGPILFVGKLES